MSVTYQRLATTFRHHRAELALIIGPSVAGAAALGFATASADGSTGFYVGTFIAAAVWWLTWWLSGSGLAESAAGEPRRKIRWKAFAVASPRHEALRGFLLGAGLLIIFLLSALVVMRIPLFAESVDKLMNNVRVGGIALTALTTAINAAGEEVFFRFVVIRQLSRLGMSASTMAVVAVGIYALVTVAMGVALLVFAAVVLGALTYYEARRSAAVISPIVAHMTWSLGMLFFLPLTL